MKNKFLASVVLGAGITFGGLFSQTVDASELTNQDLAHMAKENSVVLNQEPIKEGDYNITFTDGEYNYHFWNIDGTFGWKYEIVGHSERFKRLENNLDAQSPTQVHTERLNKHQNTQNQQINHKQEQTTTNKVDKQQRQFDYQNKVDTQKKIETPKKKQETTSNPSGGSVESRILEAGGDQAMIEIAKRESTLNPNATNPSSGAQGLFQGLGKNWSNGSVEDQTKGAKQYMIDRYGSTEAALRFHDSHNYY